ncbi:MAG: cytochrome P450 [Planctomycetota bacterium]
MTTLAPVTPATALSTARALPPGPRSTLLSTYRLMAAPLRWFPAWRERYGDPFTVPAVNGTVVMSGEPEAIRAIFAAPGRTFLPFAPQATIPLTGERSIFTSSGEEHRRDRGLVGQAFQAGRAAAFAPRMAEVAARHAARLADGQPFVAQDWGQDVSLEVILRVVFGLEDAERLASFRAQIGRTMGALNPAFLFAPFLQRHLTWLSGYRRFARERREFARMVQEQIARARAGEAPESVLGILASAREEGYELDDAGLGDQLRTMLVAGHETTATALAFCLGWLLRHPAALERLRAEVDASSGDPAETLRLPWLGAVIQESLRIYPLVTEVLRVLAEPLELCGYRLEPGVVVSPSVLLAHWREEVFPEPMAFRPERFLERRFSPQEYLPFGGGFRRCLGASFATAELHLVLAELVRRFDLELLDEGPLRPVRRNVTIAPAGGVRVRARPR